MSGAMQELNLTSLPVSLTTHSPEETEAVGAALARAMAAGTVDGTLPSFIAMYGDLGVGKTAFVRGLASVLAPGRAVRSPTFALVNEYRVSGKRPLFHFDMYRLASADDLWDIGWEDYLDRNGICAVEWSENVRDALEDPMRITIEKLGEDSRRITIEGGDSLADLSF